MASDRGSRRGVGADGEPPPDWENGGVWGAGRGWRGFHGRGSRPAQPALPGRLGKRLGEVFPVFLRKGTGSPEQVSGFEGKFHSGARRMSSTPLGRHVPGRGPLQCCGLVCATVRDSFLRSRERRGARAQRAGATCKQTSTSGGLRSFLQTDRKGLWAKSAFLAWPLNLR